MEDPIKLRAALDALKRKNNAANLTMEQLARENLILKGIIAKQELQIKTMIIRNRKKERIIQAAVDRANATNNDYLKEITALRKELKCLSQ